MRVAVTGSGGRLGRALVAALEEAPFTGLFGPIAWHRPAFDLDAPEGFAALLDRHRPEVVVHAAAWTDVDGCARDPDLAMARNGAATTRLAEACVARSIDLVVVSTNEVFDGARSDGLGYGVDDPVNPLNAYGRSKLAGEVGSRAAFETGDDASPAGGDTSVAGGGPALGIVRTAWLYGPPGNDFPAKILAAADRARASNEPVRLVADETGSPTYSHDLAEAIVELIGAAQIAGTHHIVNSGQATRAEWARELLRQAGVAVATDDVPASTWPRPSTPPAWAVLEPTPLPGREPLRHWRVALADYLPELMRERTAARAGR